MAGEEKTTATPCRGRPRSRSPNAPDNQVRLQGAVYLCTRASASAHSGRRVGSMRRPHFIMGLRPWSGTHKTLLSFAARHDRRDRDQAPCTRQGVMCLQQDLECRKL